MVDIKVLEAGSVSLPFPFPTDDTLGREYALAILRSNGKAYRSYAVKAFVAEAFTKWHAWLPLLVTEDSPIIPCLGLDPYIKPGFFYRMRLEEKRSWPELFERLGDLTYLDLDHFAGRLTREEAIEIVRLIPSLPKVKKVRFDYRTFRIDGCPESPSVLRSAFDEIINALMARYTVMTFY